MCATCGCGQKDKKHPKFGKGPKAKDAKGKADKDKAAKKAAPGKKDKDGDKDDKKFPAFLKKKK
jgi:hypothetical protein